LKNKYKGKLTEVMLIVSNLRIKILKATRSRTLVSVHLRPG
jgi:hypothetical protein